MGNLNWARFKNIQDIGKVQFYVETGTFEGDTLELVLKSTNFKNYFGIELDNTYVERCRTRFNDKRVEIVEHNSVDGLKNTLKYCKGNTFFWLDAHFLEADSGKKPYNSDENLKTRLPLEWELECIKTRLKTYNDIIIIDDVRIYEDDKFEDGTFDEAMVRMGSSLKRTDISPYTSINPLIEDFKHTHLIYKSTANQGYVIIIPKANFTKLEEIKY